MFDWLSDDNSVTDEEHTQSLAELGAEDIWEGVEQATIDAAESIFDQESQSPITDLPSMTPRDFTEFAFRMPDGEGRYTNFSFDGRRYLQRIYNTSAPYVLLICARQTEKSTSQGNKIVSYSALVPAHRSLYVSPSATQTKTFSNDRIKEPLDTSPILRTMSRRSLSSNVFEKQFANRSKIILRYAYLNADRARGIPAWKLFLDEYQDILSENIPIIEECTSHAPIQHKAHQYSGTPKSLDNSIEDLRAKFCNQSEWVIPCDGCRHWNIVGIKNIGRHGLICERCGKRIDANHERATWAAQVGDAPWESYRIPQLIVPWIPWAELLLKYEKYPIAQFMNEVLGLSYDSGVRPLTQQQVRRCCDDAVLMRDMELYRHRQSTSPVYFGIDWGGGTSASYTVLVAATYIDSKFRVIFAKRFDGADVDPDVQLRKIFQLINYLQPAVVGTDWGGGYYPNDKLIKKYGPGRIKKFQYAARIKRKVMWVPKLQHFIVHRTEVMSDIFNAIKDKKAEFPSWAEWQEPFAADMTNIFSEYNGRLNMLQYDKTKGKTDDTFHALLYCWLASMTKVPRPDILVPKQDRDTGFPMFSQGDM